MKFTTIAIPFLLLFNTSVLAGSERFTCPSVSNPACNPGIVPAPTKRLETLETEQKKLNLDNSNSELSKKLTDAYTRLEAAESKADGTIAALVNKNSCMHNSNFDCTATNLTHQYQTKTWTNPGRYSWRVPAGVTSVYVLAVSGIGSNFYIRKDYYVSKPPMWR